MATIEDLPPELLVNIFSHYVRSEGQMELLRNIPRVCKIWNNLLSSASLWRDVRVQNSDYFLHLSRRGFLYHTQRLEIDAFNEYDGDNDSFFDDDLSEMDLSPVLKNIRDLKALTLWNMTVSSDTIKHITELCPNLERLNLDTDELSNRTLYEFDQFFTTRGPTLKGLNLRYYGGSQIAGHQLLSGIAANCLVLETLELSFRGASFMVFDNISRIPSDKLKILNINFDFLDANLQGLGIAVWKWRRNLTVLKFWISGCDITSVLERYLQDNPDPQIKSLLIRCEVNENFMKLFVQKCKNLVHLDINHNIFEGRERIEMSF